MMKKYKQKSILRRLARRAYRALNYDLFTAETLHPPPPVTFHTAIRQATIPTLTSHISPAVPAGKKGELPEVADLDRLFDRFNWMYFGGRLQRVTIEYSNRMRCAGSYTPADRRIKIGRKYHELFPEQLEDTLKHEMIHIVNPSHDAKFKAEAARIGASLKATYHPSLHRPPKYLYECPGCQKEYPRQKRLVLASCGKCSKGGRFDKRFKLKLRKKKNCPKQEILQ